MQAVALEATPERVPGFPGAARQLAASSGQICANAPPAPRMHARHADVARQGRAARRARLTIVVEQPGDREDLVDPIGHLLDKARPSESLSVSNAAGHFKVEPDGSTARSLPCRPMELLTEHPDGLRALVAPHPSARPRTAPSERVQSFERR